MKISTRNINLSESNKTFLESKLSAYSNECDVDFNSKTKEFKVSAFLSIQGLKKKKFYKVTSSDFHQAVLTLSDKMQNGYSNNAHLVSNKRKRTSFKNKRNEESALEQNDEDLDLEE